MQKVLSIMLSSLKPVALAMAAALATAAPAQAETKFLLTFLDGTSDIERAAFTQAAANWSALLSTDITVNLAVGTAPMAPSVLGSAAGSIVRMQYRNVRTALETHATSATDAIAVANLPAGNNLPLLINGTSNNPNGQASFVPYLDNTGINTSSMKMTSANSRALDLVPYLNIVTRPANCIGTNCDGVITLNSNASWDLTPEDGITPGTFDFIGTAMHEIAHTLGFVGGVDMLDSSIANVNNAPSNSLYADDNFVNVMPLDLYRCSAASAAQSALDWTAGTNTGDRFFAIDGCDTSLGSLSTGERWGDGRQVSHWKESGADLGLMNPTAPLGQPLLLKQRDLVAIDAIGWNLASTTVAASTVATPAPASALVFAMGLAGLVPLRRRATTA